MILSTKSIHTLVGLCACFRASHTFITRYYLDITCFAQVVGATESPAQQQQQQNPLK